MVDLLMALGVDAAAGWDASVLAARVNSVGGIARYDDGGSAKLSPPRRQLFDDVTAHQSSGGVVAIEPDQMQDDGAKKPVAKKKSTAKPKSKPKLKSRPVPAAAVVKAAPKKPAKKPAKTGPVDVDVKPPSSAPWAVWKAYWAKHPKTVPTRGPGVLRSVIRELRFAGKAKNPRGVTKEQLVSLLAQEHTDRDPNKMRNYVSNMVPTRLREEYGIHVWTNKPRGAPTGYYLVGDGKTPQPDE